MWVRCADCPVRTKPLFRQFTPEELVFVTDAKQAQFNIPARESIVDSMTNPTDMFTLLSGWAMRFKSLPNGDRQILDFLLPGDLVGLAAPLLGRLRHEVSALTDVTVCELASASIKTIFLAQPALAASLVQTLLLDDERADRRVLMLGRQRPTQRLAYLLLELHERLMARGEATDDRCALPLTYEHFADALGVSRAQLARSLNEIKERGWARLHGGELAFVDREAMSRYAAYDVAIERQLRALI